MLTTRLHLPPSYRLSGAMPLLPTYMLSWRGQGQLCRVYIAIYLFGLLFTVNKTCRGISRFLFQHPRHTIRHIVFLAVHAHSHTHSPTNEFDITHNVFILQPNARAGAQALSCRPLHWKPTVNFRKLLVGFTVNEVALGQVFLPVLRFAPLSITAPTLHLHSSITTLYSRCT
jgi:hypothetical protein